MTNYEELREAVGTTVKAYRGEGMCLLAFDLRPDVIRNDFVGFTIECHPPDGAPGAFFPLSNRLAFDYPDPARKWFPSTEAPFQKFRWLHVPGRNSR